jgi:serine/threonine-protein kinase RsbW
MKLDLHATPEEVMRAVDALQGFAREQGVMETMIFGLALALEECGSNIVNHALRRDSTKSFHVAFEKSGDEFIVELRDAGPAFDPTSVPKGKPRAEDEDLPGGWGIELVRRYTDEIRYVRENGQNVLRLMKKISPGAGQKIFAPTE